MGTAQTTALVFRNCAEETNGRLDTFRDLSFLPCVLTRRIVRMRKTVVNLGARQEAHVRLTGMVRRY